eukprot:4813716-Pyramimonas_sp.AAC.1
MAHATLTPFSHARPSAPDDLAGAPRVTDPPPKAARMQLKGDGGHAMPSPEEADEINPRRGHVRPYMDPALSHKRPAYIGLVRRLLK